ncbi:MAG: T9SS type A sorting domain-containing protein, partial [Ignavibacteria bacterium]
ITCQNCSLYVYNTNFGNVKNDTNSYVIKTIDCSMIDVRNNSFTFNGQSMNGSISITHYDNTVTPNIYIGGNSFTSDVSTLPAISLMSYAGITIPALIENNIFNSNETNGSYNILLSSITGAVVKSNSFTNSDRVLSCLSSSIDFAENTVSSTISGSKSVECLSGSEVRMTRSGGYFLGGLNTISNTGTSSDNIYVESSNFILDEGENIFNIGDNTSSYHLFGYFPASLPVSTSEVHNCFKVNNTPVDPPINNVTLGNGGTQIAFTFSPYLPECTTGSGLGGFALINLGSGIYDTIPQYNGSGGSQRRAFDLQSAKQRYDSISIQMRYRNYNYVKTKCMELINAYPDSLQSLNAISKLYLATSATDTTYAGLTALKTYYENLILNNGDNPSLVARCFYYIQKCKVLLHDYTGAMQGFQTIMNNNPYTYEGLVSLWDYMAVSLLMNGRGGGEEPVEQTFITTDPTVEQTFLSVHDYDDGPKDKSPWNKEQRQTIRKSINKSIWTARNEQEKHIETLTKQSREGNEDAKIQLKVANTLKDIVKSRKPNSITEHIKMVSNDIQKIVSTAAGRKSTKITNNIPTVFSLSQNYPNPFNPTTTIKYALPKDVKVTVKIYDILGKLVITIVNSEMKKAGYYEAQFDGTNFASGVYFYRIEALAPSRDKFVQSKKMVLVK